MKILVTGSNGQLGRHFRLLAPQSKHQWLFTDVEELDITCREQVFAMVEREGVDMIVNCAAYTNVDQAEHEEKAACLINAAAVSYMAEAMRRTDGTLIHFSTDYVFGGEMHNTPCGEDMAPHPLGAYGRTKLLGEQAALGCRSVVVRTSWLYSEYGKNFLLTMARLTGERKQVQVVYDQVGTPTYAGDLARAVFTLIEAGQADRCGLYHYSNEGVCSWYDFAVEIARLLGHEDCRILPCRSSEYPSEVVRPSYSVLDKRLFKHTFGQEVPHWTDALRRCISNIKAT